MSAVFKFTNSQDRLIEFRGQSVLIDDVDELY